jgi:hypothetical protein
MQAIQYTLRATELVQVVQSSLNLSLHGAKNQAGQIRP